MEGFLSPLTTMALTAKELLHIFQTMPDPYCRADETGLVVIVSQSISDLLGYSQDELIGRSVTDFYDEPDSHQEMLAEMVRSGGRLRGYEVTLRHKEGRRLWVAVNVQFLYGDKGSVIGMEGYCRDITENRKSTEKLRQSEHDLSTIFNHLLDVYYRTDREGRLLLMSPSVNTLLGYTQEELLGCSLCDLYVDPFARDRFLQRLKSQGGIFYGFENKLRRKDGGEIWAVASSQFYYDENNNIAGVEGIVKDITERKEAEDELYRYSRELQETVKDLETICYSIAHDLSGPLRALNGYSHILQDEFGAFAGEEGNRTIGLIHKNVSRMATLIDDVLSFARAARGNKNLVKFCMRQMFEDVIDSMDARTVKFRIGPLPEVYGDRSLIQTAIVNLMENAVKFTSKQACPQVEIGYHAKDGEYVFYIRDNGIGIDQQYANRLFGLFEQLHDGDYSGTGVGLAIVERIVHRHGGRVWAEGEIEQGSTFYFTMPIDSA